MIGKSTMNYELMHTKLEFHILVRVCFVFRPTVLPPEDVSGLEKGQGNASVKIVTLNAYQ